MPRPVPERCGLLLGYLHLIERLKPFPPPSVLRDVPRTDRGRRYNSGVGMSGWEAVRSPCPVPGPLDLPEPLHSIRNFGSSAGCG